MLRFKTSTTRNLTRLLKNTVKTNTFIHTPVRFAASIPYENDILDSELKWAPRPILFKNSKNNNITNNSNNKSIPKDKKKDRKKEDDDSNEVPVNKNNNIAEQKGKSSSSAGTGSGAPATPPNSNNDNGGGGNGGHDPVKPDTSLPEVYPQMLALPISRRPLFPGFYKAVVISDPDVMKAITEMLDRQQPYIGAFMLKDSSIDTDIIKNRDDVHSVGVLAQITSAFPSKDEKTGSETMTALLYPHRRIKIDELVPPVITEKTKEPQDIKNIIVEKIVEPIEKESKSSETVSDKSNDEENTNSKSKDIEVKDQNDAEPSEQNTIVGGSSKSDDILISEFNPTEFLKKFNVSLVNVSNLEDEPFDRKSPVINALTSEILKVFKEISQLNTMFREQIATFSASIQSATTNIFEEPARLADFAAAVSAGEEDELQDILSSLNIEERLEKSLLVLKKELMNAELQNKISKDVETKIQKRQREYYLMEQLKGIKRELGIDDGRDKLIDTYKKRVEKLKLPKNVKKIFDDELMKLSTLETSMSEFGVTRNYLDWITSLPWGLISKEQYSIDVAKTILDEDHYGMKDVKDRILEFIAVGKLLGKVDGKIICFVGPPGVGKTSIGKSIARALNRKFFRFSVGGMSDVAEIKGHRRTYIGALPGRIIQALKKCQTQNPLILIDEIDKIGHGGMHGDPSSALLEVLDPEQNNSFLDNYLDIPIDLSKVLFVCTANTLDTIPRPLLDRMEVIELTGYVADEKVQIAERYLVPQARKTAGLSNANVELTENATIALMKHYCRESGVRNLKKQIEKIYRKAALNILKKIAETSDPVVEPALTSTTTNTNVKEDESKDIEIEKEEDKSTAMVIPDDISISITPENLKDYVGPPIYTTDRLYETTPPGIVMGLAWTSMGGCSLYVESVLEQPLHNCKHPTLERTGQLGDVMKESSRLAYSFSKMFLANKFPENRFFQQASIHLHCPEGATPKDGPSAGVTMATSFLSLALNRSIEPTVAMTGELTLTGKVLRIGGLREKAVAAKRSGAKTIIFPKDNWSDWEELPANVKEGLTPLPADWYGDIFKKLFPDVSTEEGNAVWASEFALLDAKKNKDHGDDN
ncbi:similar to Saccharomyces cerevisiae YBL022C PIM1 ATP-dependent Lon protease, involved in degradation of misfolded proteins in mitochondria [Maudiozyma saulgeensis]|uniref:Lon protease homolog, mitochondrial n=1 Tax=Maudiozyma saulgeensis TaxID=1789683 RepID=A0A1X7QZ62_9SACH|nr:similar to Saccharomyces cerevisiae YBL022C PIM1 ATP-dependent Lon protease, involved in degradation of misfolded proteins in mitochondria [Kazachstania saulgeensis]